MRLTCLDRNNVLAVCDASGMRVAERVNDVWRYMIYDVFGKLVAEYDTPDGGNGVKYVQQDWQGSVRTTTTSAGFVSSRTDYTAFGEEIGAGVGLRTAQQGFGTAASQRQGYGLTEKDPTGLDHTWFRKNENQAGRWTSPDPYNGSMSLGDPQSFNRYSYVENQPTNFIDPSGLSMVHFVCYDVTTYSSNGTHSRTDTTTICHFFGSGGSPWDTPDPTTSGWDFPGSGDGRGTELEPPANDPCAGKKGTLDFSKKMDKHIFPRHIATSTYPGRSKYTFWPWQRTKGQYKSQVESFGQATFDNGKAVAAGNSVVYTYAFFGITFGDRWIFREVGVDGKSGQKTNVNTIVVDRGDCKTVVTAHPGLPEQFGRFDIPGAMFRAGGTSTQHTSPF